METFALFLEAAKFALERIPGKGNGLIATAPILKGDVVIRATGIVIEDADWQLIQGTELERLYGLKWGDEHVIILGNKNDPWPVFKFSNPLEWNRVSQTDLVKRRPHFKDGIKLGAFNYINHSYDPNVRDVIGPKYHVEVTAIKDIPIGREITKRYNKAGREAIYRIIR